MDFRAISKTYSNKIKSSLGIKTKFADRFSKDLSGFGLDAQYEIMFFSMSLVVLDFLNFIKKKSDIKSSLEVGCSTGLFPRILPDVSKNIGYCGLDVIENSLEIAKQKSDFEFICQNFTENFESKFDLIFSFAVIDHVTDPDRFISQVANLCNKYAYIYSYRGYFPNLSNHEMNWRNDHGINYNNLSTKQLEKTLLESGLTKDQFTIRPQKMRTKILYDSDLQRFWKLANNEQKKSVLNYLKCDENTLNNLPSGLEISSDFVDKHENIDKIVAEYLGYSTSSDVFRDAMVIEIIKK